MVQIPSRLSGEVVIYIDETGVVHPTVAAKLRAQAELQTLFTRRRRSTAARNFNLNRASPLVSLPTELILQIAIFILTPSTPTIPRPWYQRRRPRPEPIPPYTHLFALILASRHFHMALYETLLYAALSSNVRALHSAIIQANIPLLELFFQTYSSLRIPPSQWLNTRCPLFGDRFSSPSACPGTHIQLESYTYLNKRFNLEYIALEHAIAAFFHNRCVDRRGGAARAQEMESARLQVLSMLVDKGADIFQECDLSGFGVGSRWLPRSPRMCPVVWVVEGGWEGAIRLFTKKVMGERDWVVEVKNTVTEMSLKECKARLMNEVWLRE